MKELLDFLETLGAPREEAARILETEDMGPIIALILQFLPQLIDSLVKKEKYAEVNGFKGPWTTFIESPGVKEGLTAAAASYDRCCKEMAAKPK